MEAGPRLSPASIARPERRVTTLNNVQIRLPEIVVPGRRLGRHIGHDIRSARYLVAEASTPETVRWDRRVPVLDQGTLGSCTGNATVGVLGTEPYYTALTPVQRQALDEAEAVRIYSLATQLDPWPGTWEPEDTGSDGNSAAKAAQRFGYLSGYQHITSLAAAHNAIKSGPFITGLNWMSGMDEPNGEGVIRATGYVRGGHEFEVAGYDASAGLWQCWNSWGDSYGKNGSMYLPDEDFAGLLAQQGDATTFVPVTQPAPQPAPEPAADFPWASVDPWLASPHGWRKATAAAKAVSDWKADNQ